jgi:hypothetical protein
MIPAPRDPALLPDPVAKKLLVATVPARLAYNWTDGSPRVAPRAWALSEAGLNLTLLRSRVIDAGGAHRDDTDPPAPGRAITPEES